MFLIIDFIISKKDFVTRDQDGRDNNWLNYLINVFPCLRRSGPGAESDLLRSQGSVTFTEYEPWHFRRVRAVFGVSDEIYNEEFSKTMKERLIEGGASGAFFFFSKGQAYIAKSCTSEELLNLKINAKEYAQHMEDNPGSFITRIFGVYMLRIYGTELNFFVMNNLFLTNNPNEVIEKYDIKGSTVNRSASRPQEGGKATCSQCNQDFIYRKKSPNVNRRYASESGPKRSFTASSGSPSSDNPIQTFSQNFFLTPSTPGDVENMRKQRERKR